MGWVVDGLVYQALLHLINNEITKFAMSLVIDWVLSMDENGGHACMVRGG